MEPSVLIGIALALGKQLLSLITYACKSASNSAALQDELELFLTQLHDNLQYVEKRLVHLASTDFIPSALENLVSELNDFLCTAEELLERRFKQKDIQKLREDVINTFQTRMTSAIFELQVEMYRDLKAMKERMEEKQAVQIIIIQEQARGNPKLGRALSFVRNTPHPTKTFRESFKDVLALEHYNLVVPTSTAASTSRAHQIRKSGNKEDQKEAKSVKQFQKEELKMMNATKENQKEAKSVKQFQKEELKMTKATKENLKEANPVKQFQKEELKMMKATKENQEIKDDNIKDNPNRLMSFIRGESGKGQLYTSRCNDGKIEVIYEGPIAVRGVMGKRPMKVSEKVNYFYFQVKLEEMVELLESRTRVEAGVGVGLAWREEFRNDKMVGWYRKSFGYDGRMGEVYGEQSPQEPFRIGILAKGDILGIGLLQLPGQHPAIFFVKNGVLQGYTQNHCFGRSSAQLLHPVVSLASRRARLCVNFDGPFHLPSGLDLAAALGITQ